MLRSLFLGLAIVMIITACGGGSGSSHKTGAGSGQPVSSVTSFSSVSTSASVSSSSASSGNGALSSASSSASVALMGQVAVLGDPGTAPIMVVANPSYSPIVDETLELDWFAFSAKQSIVSVTWTQISGPPVVITPGAGLVNLRATAAGDVTLEGKVTDDLGQVSSTQVSYRVKAPFSSKAKLLSGRSDGVGVDLVIVGDGFKADQQQQLLNAAKTFITRFSDIDVKGIKPQVPLWNFWLVDSVSASDVINATDAGGGSNTLFKSYFNCNSIARLLCVDTNLVTPYVATHVPQYDLILVVVNSTTYGGAGYEGLRLATFSLSDSAYQVAVHELGHSFANLGDEYESNDGQGAPVGEFSSPDLTIETNPRIVKWAHWITDIQNIAGVDHTQTSETEVGYFKGGAYVTEGVWRPTATSMMRELGKPLGAVNSEAWAISVWAASATNPLPQELATGTNQYRVLYSPSISGTNIQSISWTLDGQPIVTAANKNFLLVGNGNMSSNLAVSLQDATGLIRKNPQHAGEITRTFSAP